MRRTFARTRCTTDRTHMSTMWLEENTYDSSPRTAGLLAVLANLNPMDCFVWGYTSILYLETHILYVYQQTCSQLPDQLHQGELQKHGQDYGD